ncbi:hypothetical protein CFAEC_13720 (plasmid) [Corynebacterium faecale]|uniref:hypothetical protein n=1 Tax=Corynebacterium faecale TaxID=1758466 RepID=UPI0025B2DAEC|nr:hypothetical protein [Corynebacterium faecale]WJY93529.1 hypothetical protein CFAEC_13720 [Corynebacterium faecale]
MPHKPKWFKDGEVFISFADTCGINKDGNTLYTVDPATGERTTTIDDKLIEDVYALLDEQAASTGRWVPESDLSIGAPRYYDTRYTKEVEELLEKPEFSGFSQRTIGSLVEEGLLFTRAGHGSPSADKRRGDIPYIKVSDVRAGQININPTNLVSEVIAHKFWRGETSGLIPFDLITPIRASKNIGEFAVLMPGQERIVLTKEMLVLRATEQAPVDNFYLLWALSLTVVRQQWNRIVLMQTNREDVGKRYLEIEIPWIDDSARAAEISASFRDYYIGLDELRRSFVADLEQGGIHHVFLGAEATELETE